MRYDWIMDVLADLKAFAQANGLNKLAEQLEDTSHVATIEIASRSGEAMSVAERQAEEAGSDPGEFGTSV